MDDAIADNLAEAAELPLMSVETGFPCEPGFVAEEAKPSLMWVETDPPRELGFECFVDAVPCVPELLRLVGSKIALRDFTDNGLPEVEEMPDELRDSIGTAAEDSAKSSRRKEPWMGCERWGNIRPAICCAWRRAEFRDVQHRAYRKSGNEL
ncbi:hypothetical protein C8R44DRAFT_822140 [Mycena epipterygia]|nr:hypothetical protein C8R44DRAFT_822140 [Mycena epipterygia]